MLKLVDFNCMFTAVPILFSACLAVLEQWNIKCINFWKWFARLPNTHDAFNRIRWTTKQMILKFHCQGRDCPCHFWQASGSSTATCFWYLSFVLVPTFFWLDCFNHDAAFISRSASRFFLRSSFEKGLFFAFSWCAFLCFMLPATYFNGSNQCFLYHSVNESGFLGEVSIELSFLVLPISYSSWNTVKLETMNNKVPKNPSFIPCRTDTKR